MAAGAIPLILVPWIYSNNTTRNLCVVFFPNNERKNFDMMTINIVISKLEELIKAKLSFIVIE